jgi:lysozyme family protein
VDSEFLTFIGFVIDHEGRSFENDPNDHAVDGVLGPLTLAAAARSDGPKLAMGMLSLRDEHYQLIAQDDPREAVYLQGWLNRVSDLQRWISGFPIV